MHAFIITIFFMIKVLLLAVWIALVVIAVYKTLLAIRKRRMRRAR